MLIEQCDERKIHKIRILPPPTEEQEAAGPS